jgi:hypothetical protein
VAHCDGAALDRSENLKSVAPEVIKVLLLSSAAPMRARVKFLNSDDIYVQLSQHFKCTFRVAPSVQANNLWMLYVTRIPPPVLSLSKADIDKK